MQQFVVFSVIILAVGKQDGYLEIVRVSSHVTPKLDPERPKKFEKDYSDDGRPDIKMLKNKGFHDFKLPFPTVQSSDKFDRDYVKDENGDNGEWQAQADFDYLKGKLEKGQKALVVAQKKNMVEKGYSDDLIAKMKASQDRVGKARSETEKQRKARKEFEAEEAAAWAKAQKEREAAGNTTAATIPKDPVDKAQWFLDKEEKEFEQCKKELEAARAKMAEVQKAYEAKVAALAKLDIDTKKQLAKEAEEEDNQVADLKKKEESELAEEVAANKAEEEAKGNQAAVQRDADAEKKRMDAIESKIAIAKENLQSAEGDLEKAECALRHYRGEKPCADSTGPYAELHAKKSSGGSVAVGSSLLVAIVALVACAL